MAKHLLPILFSETFMISGLHFKSSILFEFLKPNNAKKMVLFNMFICTCPVFPELFIEKIIYFPLYSLTSCVENLLTINAWAYL